MYEPEVPHTYKNEVWDENSFLNSLPCLRFPTHVTHGQRNQPLDLAVENVRADALCIYKPELITP